MTSSKILNVDDGDWWMTGVFLNVGKIIDLGRL